MSDSHINDTLPGDNQELATSAPEPVSPGARLAAEREANGWTIEQVAAYLKLAPRQVVAIEKDDYAALPGMPIARGFVRSYAKLLKVDAAPLLVQMGGEPGRGQETLRPTDDLSAPFSEARIPSMSEKSGLSSAWVIGILLVVLLGVAFWAFRDQGGTAPQPLPAPEASEPAASEAVAEYANAVQEELAVSSASADDVNPAAADAPATSAVAPAVQQAVPTPVPTPAVAPAPAPAVPAPQSATPPASAHVAGADVLRLTMREESWIEVRRGAGEDPVVSRLAQPGENISIAMSEPVELVVGNVSGVDATLRGKPLALKGIGTSNVARLRVK